MTQKLWIAVDDYINDLFLPSDPMMSDVLKASEDAGLPSISVTPTEGKLLMFLAQVSGAQSILEIGTLGAYSTIWLARGLSTGGKLITLESNPKHADVARANIIRAGLSDRVDILVGDANDTLARLATDSRNLFDIIFIDADKESYPEYLAWALKLSHTGSLIIADNVIRDGEILDAASSDPRVQGTRRFNQLLAAEPRLTTTVIQTIGRKGHDGIAIAMVVPK
jgi:predicted O-methyltransferase YrrM